MTATDTMRWMGRSARNRAQWMGHSMKDRVLERRLERASDESDRLRMENDMLRDEVQQTRSEHERILDLLESRLSAPQEVEVDVEQRKSHKGRWLLFLTAIGGGAYAWMRMRGQNGHNEWQEMTEGQAATQTGSAGI
jgi:hypothetical protein